MLWARATSPHPAPRRPDGPDGALELVGVENALVSGFDRGVLATTMPPSQWMVGAVHDAEGALVSASQRGWHGDPLAPVAADRTHLDPPDEVRQLRGTWLYGGHWTGHFGHFLSEVVTNLWPGPADVAPEGLLFHRSFRGPLPPPRRGLSEPRIAPWQRDLLDLAGYGDVRVRVVQRRPVRAERLVVPRRPVLLKSWALPEACRVWDRIGQEVDRRDAVRARSPRVFLSRRLFHAEQDGDPRHVRVSAAWEARLEDLFAARGFVVVHPERLGVAEQVALLRGIEVVAGSAGSALHLAVFAPRGSRVVEIGDERSPTAMMATQRMLDAACGHVEAFVPYLDETRAVEVLDALEEAPSAVDE